MKPNQIAQLQEIDRCYLLPLDRGYVNVFLRWTELPYNKFDKAIVRRLTHQYKHQIAAMRKNRMAA